MSHHAPAAPSRTRLALFEFATGGGLLAAAEQLPASILVEGAAMLRGLTHDLARIEGSTVRVLRDHRVAVSLPTAVRAETVRSGAELRPALADLACWAERTIVIAPESDGWLERCARWVVAAGGALLGPPPEMIALAADKHRTAETLQAAGLPVPDGKLLPPGTPLPEPLAYPCVVKPIDGAGSVGLRYLADRRCAAELLPRQQPTRVESYCPGLPASVAVLAGPAGLLPLIPCRQRLVAADHFRYGGGTMPLDRPRADRAAALARRAVEALGAAVGYLGVDLVLGPAADGSQDVVIEINPRLTTSYVGLRAATSGNLAETMLAVAEGREAEILFDRLPVSFAPDGTVRRDVPVE